MIYCPKLNWKVNSKKNKTSAADEETVEVTAYTDDDMMDEEETVTATVVSNEIGMAEVSGAQDPEDTPDHTKAKPINPKEYAKPLREFVGVRSKIYLGFTSTDTSDAESVPARISAALARDEVVEVVEEPAA